MSTLLFRFIFLTVCFIHLDCELYQDRPVIRIENGDLVLQTAFDKDVHIRANGPKSKIFVGGINFLELNTTGNPGPPSATTSDALDNYLNGPNGILKRLDALEAQRGTQPADVFANITILWRRVNRLTLRVSNLQNQLNSRLTDECTSRPCINGGTCLNLVNGYHCLCPSNWEGLNCDVDVNECRNFAGTDLGCQNGAECINKPGSYECKCKQGWYGLHCTRRSKDCSGENFEMCGHGTCVPVTTGEGIKCICDQGWTTNETGVACLTDINECESSQGPRCSVNPRVDCINLPGSFRCGQCPQGYEGDGYVCSDIDECIAIPNGGCSTSPLVTCHNTIGSRICGACPPGYQGDGITCSWRGSCNINRGGCHPSAQCLDNPALGGQIAQCICPPGMEGDGVGLNGCYISTGNYSRGCETNPCGIHGQCHQLRSSYTCICYRGYGGARCDTVNNYCATNPCLNGGRCSVDESTARGFRCECTALYTGDLCHVASKTCGGLLQAEEGSIIYPLTNTTYNHNARCAWVIQTDHDKVINVTFSKFNLEAYPECSSDFLQIHDGRSSASQIIGRFCGNEFPKGGNIISTHNNLYFWFRSDQTVAKDGFALHWTSIKPFCGGEIDATTHGHISSPGSPGKYPPNRDCYWHLTTTLGKRIQLHFFSLDIESHSNCSYDYIEIYDGERSSDPLLNRYCNSTQPPPIQSAGSILLIHFHSDAYSSGYGFQIAFAPADGVPGCGGYYTSDKGEISSPTYEGTYLSNLVCDYRIRTSPDTKVRLNFERFYLERSRGCRYDYLKIYDGPDENSRLVGRFCGRTFPATYTASTNQLYLKFKSDHSVSYEGFKINYDIVCEETILGDSGVVKSPGYPFTYPANRVCEYIIGTSPGKAIQLVFQDFDIEDSNHYECHYDSLQIRDGHNGNASLFGKYCGGVGHTPPLITSTLNYLYLKFTSDRSISGTGFYANFTTVNISCGGIFRETTGMINYPSDSSLYDNGQSCTWILIAPLGMHIKITWNRFDVEKMPSCRSDYVELNEIDDNNESNRLGKYCGTTHPPAVTTTTNTLKIIFVSDRSVRSEGFSLSYSFLDEKTHCGGTLTKIRGVLHSPGWPKKYDNRRDCTWTIRAAPGQQVKLNISQFDLEGPIRNKCDFGDYLEIKNGAFPEAPIIGKYCGSFRNKRIVSMSHDIVLHFHSDSYITGRGFEIEWDSTVIGCGGTLTSPSGTIASPNYPSPYNENAECFYKVIVSAGSRIRLNFNELELERTSKCTDDYIEIFDGRDENSPSLGRYCYMKPELRNIGTSTNVAFIKFRSDFYIGAKGFLMQYNTVCLNNLTGLYGAIESPGYPNGYPMNLNCLWTINVPLGNKINLTFTDFDVLDSLGGWRPSYLSTPGVLQRSLHCINDYVQMRDTTDTNVPERFCGKTLPKTHTSRTNSMQIKFVTDAIISRKGFRLEWVRHGCGGHVQKSFGIIEINNSISIEKVECEWIIETPPGTQVSLNVYQVYMMSAVNCSIDALEIYNGPNVNAPLLTKSCHNNMEGTSLSATSNFMLVRFLMHSSLKDVQFKASFDSYKTGCGGRINALSGIIHSKNYPQNYDNELNCMWTLAVPLNHKIELNFIDIDLYDNNGFNEDCGDSIKLYDEQYVLDKNYTQQICSNTRAAKIISKNNILGVQFVTDSSGTAKGFKANFTVTCGATIKANYEGILANDRWHSTYIDNNCTWTILAPSLEKKISLSITYMSIPKDNDIVTNRKCSTSYLRIYDGNDIQAPVIGEYCGRKVPPMIVSKGSALTVVFGAYKGTAQGTFSSHYSPLDSACGGSLSSEEGTIASPNYPLSYPVSIDCEWMLSTSAGNRVYINFEQFDLEYSENCNEDYLEVREYNGMGRLLGVYCGNDLPSNTSIGTELYIKFHSNSKNSGQGFVLHYGFLHGNEITGDQGVITSPLYPNNYDGPGEYNWRITTDEGKFISMVLTRLQIPNNGEMCFNSLTFYDGYDEEATVLGEFCGIVSKEKEIKTTSNVGFIKLTLDDSNWGTIFNIVWANSDTFIETTASNDKVNCGNSTIVKLSPGQTISLKSPGYPTEYSNDLNCEWVYKATTGRHVSLVFKEIKLEETPMCFADHISVYSSETSSAWNPIISSICLKEQVTSEINSTKSMKITFRTDSSITNVGFEAEVNSMCGGLMTDLSGVVGPTWMDSKNRYTMQCHYKIKVRPGRVIKLNFEQFNITNDNDNCLIYVVIRNGESAEAPMLGSGKYCGYDHENRGELESSSNSVFITYSREVIYTSDITLKGFKTFRIRYEEKGLECGQNSKLDSDHNFEIINSPNYPSVPIPYSECIWVFTGPPGEILRIDFIERFDLDRRNDCSLEYIEIRDGTTEYSPLKGRYCRDKPGTIKVTNNVILIKYHSQIDEPRNGFKANVSIDICGGTIIARKGEVVSPGYPHLMPIPYGAVCEWRIIGSHRQTFMINPQDIHLPESETECGTKISVEESVPINKTIVVLRTYCSDQEYNTDDLYPFETSTNEVSIKLHVGKTSEWSPTSSHRGFRFTFNTSRLTCGGDLSISEGYLSTPGYPRETILRYCKWKITVPDRARRIRLEILDADLEKHRIDLYNDLRYQSHLGLVNGNGSAIQRVFESTGNTLSVSLWLKTLATRHRFKAKFSSDQPALCGGSLSGATGTLVSPDLDRSYFCEWKYKPETQAQESNMTVYDTLLMTIKLNSSITRTRCGSFDSKVTINIPEVFANVEYYGTMLPFCGNVDTKIRLPANKIGLIANTNNRASLYFKIEWITKPCGGLINIGDTEINILNIPANYNDSIDCVWFIRAPTVSRLQMTLEGSFELDCDNEYLKIKTGLGTPIGDYCKDRLQVSPLVVPFKRFVVEYHASSKKQPPIKLLAKSVTDHCGGLLLSLYNSIFHSPHFPGSYDNNIECTWEIKTSVGNRISLHFIDRFAIEDVTNCTKDAVIVYDWQEGEYAEVARLCGRVIPPVINSTFNQMKIVFRTDAATTLDGFKAMWQPICGGKFTATYEEQYIYSPGYPNEYLPNQDCKYVISGEDKKIFIKFLEFELEGTYPTCRYDNMTLTANSDYNYLENSYCGSYIPPPSHEYTEMTLTFKTDLYTQRKGFKLAYSVYKCGGDIKNPTMITSHLGENYDPDENCTWKIEAPSDKVVVVKFQYIDLERTTECYNDYVAVFNGLSIDNNKRLALLCGHILSPTELQSDNNTMLLQFVSDSSLNYNGFKAFVYFTYSSAVGCGGNINLPATSTYTLKSPLIGNNSVLYENFLKCRWIISAPQDHVIRIEFKNFHIASCNSVNQTALGFSKCDCDYVEVKDGLNPSALVIGTYCGHTLPPPLISSNNRLSVILSTDGELQSSGFEAFLRVQRSVCGQAHILVSHTAQSLKSPGFDTGSIPRGIHCFYSFNNPEEYLMVHLLLKTIDVRAGSLDPNQCDQDKVIVSNTSPIHNMSLGKDFILNNNKDFFDTSDYINYEEQMDSPQELVFCGKKQNLDLYLTGSVVVSVQTSSESDGAAHRGVELEAVYAGFCGRNYTEPYGRIKSYLRNTGETQKDCYTLVTAPENHTIAVYFLQAAPDYWNNDVYLDVYDGKQTNAPKLLRIQRSFDNGDTPVFSSGRYLLLHNHFVSGDQVTFDLNYVTTDKRPGCGGKMYGIVGKLTSPMYPNFYRVKGSCEWELETPLNTKLRLRFTVFDLGVNCEQNYVQLIDRSGGVISTYCSETPAVYTSADNYVKVVYTTIMNNSGTGWVLQFIAVRQ